MALDPSIALGYKPPVVNLDVPSPIHQFGQLMTLRGMMEQSQARQMEMAQEQMKMDAMRQAQAGQQEFQRRTLAGENLTPGQSLGYLGPKVGGDYLKTLAERQELEHKNESQRWGELHSIIGSASDTPTYNNAVMQARSRGYINDDTARKMIEGGFKPKEVEQSLLWAMKGKEQADFRFDQAKATREATESAARLASEKAQARLRGLEYAAQTAPNDPAAWADWRAQIGETNPDALPLIPPQHSPAAYALVRQFGTKPAAGPALMSEDVLKQQQALRAPQPTPGLSPERFNQELQLRMRGAAAGNTEDAEALADTVIANPSLWDRLTPTAAGRIAPILQRKGYTEFGKAMNESALTKLSESRSAIASLQDLRQTLKDNEQYIGPISGLQAMNPYSEARQAQAKIDLVKQRVGKALEGGVLRKEDEEKYKRILATLRDTPETAIAKVDGLVETLQRDIAIFEAEQRRGGRNVRPAEGPAQTAAPQAAAPKVNTKAEYDKIPKGAQYVDAQDGKTYIKR